MRQEGAELNGYDYGAVCSSAKKANKWRWSVEVFESALQRSNINVNTVSHEEEGRGSDAPGVLPDGSPANENATLPDGIRLVKLGKGLTAISKPPGISSEQSIRRLQDYLERLLQRAQPVTVVVSPDQASCHSPGGSHTARVLEFPTIRFPGP